MNLKAPFIVLVSFLLVNISLVSSQSEDYLYVKVTSAIAPIPSPKKSPVPTPPFTKPVPVPPLTPPPAKASPPPPVYKPVPPAPPVKKPTPPPTPPPAKVTPPPTPTPPAKVSPPPPPPRPRTTKDCIPLCLVRCKLHSRKNVCLRACVTCCDRCKCVPPGQYGNREKCGKCYANMTTRGGRLKCP